MPKLIQSQARGLLSLLTSKDGGLGPAAMEDNLRITLDAASLYGLNGRATRFVSQSEAQIDAAPAGWVAGGGALTNQGWFACVPADGTTGTTDMRVPEGELWRVLGITLKANRVNGSVVLAAGWAHGMYPNWVFTQLGNVSAAVLAGQAQSAGKDVDFIAIPGSAPAFYCNSWDLGVFDFSLDVHLVYERVPL